MTAPTSPGSLSAHQEFGSHVRWSYLLNGGRMAATTVVTFILAALLGPAAFGVVAVALVYVLLLQLLQQGFIAALIQREVLTKDHENAAFWMVASTSLLLFAATLLLAGRIADLYALPDLRAVLSVLAVGLPVRGLSVVQEALLQRNMQFKALTLRTHASVLAGGAVGIAGAVAGAGVWALVAQQLVTFAVASAALWVVSRWRPQMRWSTRAARDLLGFSTRSAASSLGVFVSNRADALIMGLFFGPVAVGLYRLAYRLIDMVVEVTARSMQTVSLPHLARLQDDAAGFGARLLVLLRLVAVLALPALGILAAAAPAIVRVLGGDWIDMAPVLRVLSVAGALSALSLLIGPVLQALGRPGTMAVLSWTRAVLGVAALAVVGVAWRGEAVREQIVAAALAFAGMQALVAGSVLVIVAFRTSVSVRAQLRVTVPGIMAAVAATAAGTVRDQVGLPSINAVADLVLTAGIAGTAAAGVLLTMDSQLRGHLVRLLASARSAGKRAEQ